MTPRHRKIDFLFLAAMLIATQSLCLTAAPQPPTTQPAQPTVLTSPADLFAGLAADARPDPQNGWDEFSRPKADKWLDTHVADRRLPVAFDAVIRKIALNRISPKNQPHETLRWDVTMSLEPIPLELAGTKVNLRLDSLTPHDPNAIRVVFSFGRDNPTVTVSGDEDFARRAKALQAGQKVTIRGIVWKSQVWNSNPPELRVLLLESPTATWTAPTTQGEAAAFNPASAMPLCVTPKWVLWQTHDLVPETANRRAPTFVVRLFLQRRGERASRLVRETKGTGIAWLASVGDDGTVMLGSHDRLVWISPDGKERMKGDLDPTLNSQPMRLLLMFPDGVVVQNVPRENEPTWLWFVPFDGCNLVKGRSIALTGREGFRFPENDRMIAIARHGDELAWADNGGFHVMNIRTGDRKQWPGAKSRVDAFDGRTLVAGCLVLDLADGRRTRLDGYQNFLAVRHGIGYVVEGVESPISYSDPRPKNLRLAAVELESGKRRTLAKWPNAEIVYGAGRGPMDQAFRPRVTWYCPPAIFADDPTGLTIWDGRRWRQFAWLVRIDACPASATQSADSD